MKNFSLILCLLIMIAGCGSDDDNTPTLNDIAGVWDATVEVEGLVDELYVIISTSGDYTVYDYLGDDFNNESDCYEKLERSITDLGGGRFELQTDDAETDVGEIELSGDQLTIRTDSETITMVWTALVESDFVPVCLTINAIDEPTVISGPTEGFTLEADESLGALSQDSTSSTGTTSGGIYIYAH